MGRSLVAGESFVRAPRDSATAARVVWDAKGRKRQPRVVWGAREPNPKPKREPRSEEVVRQQAVVVADTADTGGGWDSTRRLKHIEHIEADAEQTRVLEFEELAYDLGLHAVHAAFTSGHCVAFGGYADVWKGQLPSSGAVVALKVLRINPEEVRLIRPHIVREVRIWATLSHPNILPFLGTNIQRVNGRITTIALVSPWMRYGHIRLYLNTHPEAERLVLIDGIAAGLQYLHSLNVVHNDLKAANILVDREGVPRLADYGLSAIVDGETMSYTRSTHFAGTMPWLAPERLAPEQFGLRGSNCRTTASDIYAFGMSILEIFTGAAPFYGVQIWRIVQDVPKGLRPSHPGKIAEDNGMTEAVWAFMQRCWAESHARPTAAEWSTAARS